MTRFKKIFSLLVAVVMVACLGSGVFAGEFEVTSMARALNALEESYAVQNLDEEQLARVDAFIQIYANDTTFFAESFAKNPQAAISMVKDVIDGFLLMDAEEKLQPAWMGNNIFGVNGVPTLKQATPVWCGIASTLQVITALGNAVPGANYAEKQHYLAANDFNVSESTSVIVDEIKTVINKYTSEGYAWVKCTNMDIGMFKSLLRGSLMNDYPPILHAKPNYLTSYYPSSQTSGHFITVEEMNYNDNTMTLNDCNYKDAYNGIHKVSINEAYNSIHSVAGRYLIYKPY